ncbi:MAG: hypothetical protein ACI4UA_07175 [Bacteroidaceae bacterium]
MTLRLTLFSQEVEDFVVEIKIGAEASFDDLHRLILHDCGYREVDGQQFLLCDEDWRVERRVCQRDVESRSEEDIYLMHDTLVGDLLEDEGQRMAYVFDPEAKRFFMMELTENIFGQPLASPMVSRRHGQAPLQSRQVQASGSAVQTTDDADTGENFYGDDGFEDEELDLEGFEISE